MHESYLQPISVVGFSGGSDAKESACSEEDPGLIPGLGRSPGEGNGNPLQYSCLENPMDREAWQATVYGVAKSQTRPSNFNFFLSFFLSSSALYTICCHPHRDLGQGHYTGLHYAGHYSCVSPQGNLHKPWWSLENQRTCFNLPWLGNLGAHFGASILLTDFNFKNKKICFLF